ncbi:hypothetical protein L873DRAFT_1280188 [Choiromyces venosus 120613-1]|uniref:Uncharacterized protein n=1 Tax=Choiromyces venosus 120613-1 TaxID=1336337 RepID=A0A3N4K670_9PEZI|nr:hypothetical protein L873DRAFT_1280188 [Choiromyces venosus 120613-1]
MPPKIIKFLTNQPTQNLVTHSFVRATSTSATPIPHRSSYSTIPSPQTESSGPSITPEPPSKLPIDRRAMEAEIRCQVTKDQDQERERICAVIGLGRVAMEVTKKRLGTGANTKFLSVNPAGESILGSIERMILEITEAPIESNKMVAEMQKGSDKGSNKKFSEGLKESEKMIKAYEKMYKKHNKRSKEIHCGWDKFHQELDKHHEESDKHSDKHCVELDKHCEELDKRREELDKNRQELNKDHEERNKHGEELDKLW